MIKVFDLFAGYGGTEFALKKAGIEHECVGFSEIDKYAIQCFKQNHGDITNYGDITKINLNDLPDFDLLTGGFPCQSFSVAGLGKGELDPRGTLVYDIIRIAEAKQPEYMLLENVKGFTFKKFKDTFDKVLSELDRIGYKVYWKVLNSKDFGIPQNRERVWFVCIRKDINQEFSFPIPTDKKLTLKDILLDEVEDKYYLTGEQIKRLINNTRGYNERMCKGDNTPTLCARDYKELKVISEKTRDIGFALEYATMLAKENNKPIQLDLYHLQHGQIRPLTTYIPQDFDNHRCLQAGEPKEILIYPRRYKGEKEKREYIKAIPTLYARARTDEIPILKSSYRKLTPRECFRLMGFVNDEINLDGLSDSQKYKLAGNGWEINVVSLIFKNLLNKEKL
jgi:DNA-cytosine methyltransferase